MSRMDRSMHLKICRYRLYCQNPCLPDIEFLHRAISICVVYIHFPSELCRRRIPDYNRPHTPGKSRPGRHGRYPRDTVYRGRPTSSQVVVVIAIALALSARTMPYPTEFKTINLSCSFETLAGQRLTASSKFLASVIEAILV
jgi:hypothetical protein